MSTAAGVQKSLQKVEEAIRKNNPDYAISLVQQALQASPDDTAANEWFFKAVAKKWQGKNLGKAGMLTNTKIHAMKAVKKWDAVIGAVRSAYPNEPANQKLLEFLAEAQLQSSQFNAAKVTLKMLTEMDSRNGTAWFWLAQAHQNLKEFKEAITACERAKAAEPSNKQILDLYRDVSAAESVQANINKDTMEMVKGGSAEEQAKKAGRAKETKESVQAELDEIGGIDALSDRKTAVAFAERFTKVNDFNNAIKAWKKASDLDPNFPDGLDKAGDLTITYYTSRIADCKKAGDEAKAEDFTKKRLSFQIQEYRRRVEAYPTDTNLKFKLGQALFEASKFKDAAVELQKASRDPKIADQVALTLGQCFTEIGQHQLAIMQFDRALQSVSADSKLEVMYFKGKALMAKGSKDEARELFMEILNEDFQYRDISELLAQLG